MILQPYRVWFAWF